MSVIGKLIDQVSEIKKEFGTDKYYFYRGQQENQSLLPTLLRNRNVDKIHENNLYCDSWIMAGKQLSSARNSWEILAQFQHYGIPTRLLDWTSSLINAIYFSIVNCQSCKKLIICSDGKVKNKCNGPPTVWVISPDKMHMQFHIKCKSLSQYSLITIGLDDFPDYCEYFVKLNAHSWPYNKKPLFIEIPWLSERIQTQKGYFTFHPGKLDINKMKAKNRDTFSRKIIIDQGDIFNLIEEIKVLGVSEYDVYPDLTALGSYLKRKLEG